MSDGRQHDVKSLIVVDVGSTLGRFSGDGRSTTAVLASLAPPSFPRELIARTVCRVLHRAPSLTEDVIREVCDELHIDLDAWPDPWPASSFEPYDDTVDCLARLSVSGPVVALSNLSITGRPRMEALAQTCGKYLTEIYPSYQLGGCKPARWLWRYVADLHGVRANQVIHIGDRWAEDVLGPLRVGGRAVWIRRKDIPVPGDTTALPAGRWTTVDGLAAAVEVVEQWVEE
jgi:FMN hydrolase / 5-amino-6-(5-phospho-D-ribitylamino)uracil phosphatase